MLTAERVVAPVGGGVTSKAAFYSPAMVIADN